jgi:orotidine-5'-phosphate decarboxylase
MSRERAPRSAAPQPFGSRLRAARVVRGPLCVGIDPHPALLHRWGLRDDVAGLEVFVRIVTDALADRVSMVKPQLAFFERHGSRGMAVLEQVVVEARAAGALVVLDGKRGDIGSTMQAYAEAYLDPRSPIAADALTLSPFLGFESLRPALDMAASTQGGVFVLAMTSNPEGSSVQSAVTASGQTVTESMLHRIKAENADHAPWGSVGAVVGATVGQAPAGLDVGGPLLAPGLGAQGGTPADLRRVFGPVRGHVFPVAARQVLEAGPEVGDLRAMADSLNEECRAALD